MVRLLGPEFIFVVIGDFDSVNSHLGTNLKARQSALCRTLVDELNMKDGQLITLAGDEQPDVVDALTRNKIAAYLQHS